MKKRHRRNIQSHNQYTIQGLNLGQSKNSRQASPKIQTDRGAYHERTFQNSKLKKRGNEAKGPVKGQYFIDTQMKRNGSPSLNRFNKKFENSSKLKKNKHLGKFRNKRKTKTFTEGNLQKIKRQAEEIGKLKAQKKAANSRNLEIRVPNLNLTDENSQQFKSTKNSQYKNKNKFYNDGSEMRVPFISKKGSPCVSRNTSKEKKRKKSKRSNLSKNYRKVFEETNSERTQQGTSMTGLENTGFTGQSNYGSISSKNPKNEESFVSKKSKLAKLHKKKHGFHQRHYSHHSGGLLKHLSGVGVMKNSNNLKNSQLSSNPIKTNFQKQPFPDTQQSFGSIQSGGYKKLLSKGLTSRNIPKKEGKLGSVLYKRNRTNLLQSPFGKKQNLLHKDPTISNGSKIGRLAFHQKTHSSGNYVVNNFLNGVNKRDKKYLNNRSQLTRNIAEEKFKNNSNLFNKSGKVDNRKLPFSFAANLKDKKQRLQESGVGSKNWQVLEMSENASQRIKSDYSKKQMLKDSLDISLKEKISDSINFTQSFKTNNSNSKKTFNSKNNFQRSKKSETLTQENILSEDLFSSKYSKVTPKSKSKKTPSAKMQNLMKQNHFIKTNSNYSINSMKKIETACKRNVKPTQGKDYENIQMIKRNIFNEKGKLNMTAGYSNQMSIVKFRDYATNGSSNPKQLNNSNLHPRSQRTDSENVKDIILNSKIFRREKLMGKEMLLQQFKKQTPNQLKDDFYKAKKTKKEYNSGSEKDDWKSLLDSGYQRKMILSKNSKFISSNLKKYEKGFKRTTKNLTSNTHARKNSKRVPEGYTSYRRIVAPNYKGVQNFQSYKLREEAGKELVGTPENMEKFVEYIADFGKKNINTKKDYEYPSLEQFQNDRGFSERQSVNRKSQGSHYRKKSFYEKSSLTGNLTESATIGGNSKKKSFEDRERNFEKANHQFGSKASTSRPESPNIYKCEQREKKIDGEKSIKVYDKEGRVYTVSRTVLTEEEGSIGRPPNGGSLMSLKAKTNKANFELYNKSQKRYKQDSLKMSGFLKQNILTSLEPKNILVNEEEHGILHSSELDSFAREGSGDNEEEIVLRRKRKQPETYSFKKNLITPVVNKRDLSRERVNIVEKTKKINEGLSDILLSEGEISNNQKKMIRIQKGKANSKMKNFEIFPFEMKQEESFEQKSKVMMKYSNQNKTRGKVFDLMAEEESYSKEINQINVSKKHDSGTNFFAISVKESLNESLKKIGVPKSKDLSESNQWYQNRKFSEKVPLKSERVSYKPMFNEPENILYKEKELNQQEGNLYNQISASETRNKKKKDKMEWSNSKIMVKKDKVEIRHGGQQSQRMINDLKRFGEKLSLKSPNKNKFRAKNVPLGEKKLSSKGRKKTDKNRRKPKGKRRGHKRNAHSEQYADIFTEVVNRHNIPVDLKPGQLNMTPDISRKNSLQNSEVDLEFCRKRTNEVDCETPKNIQVSHVSRIFLQKDDTLTREQNRIKEPKQISQSENDPKIKKDDEEIVSEKTSGKSSGSKQSSLKAKKKRPKNKLKDSKKVFLEDKDANKYGSNRVKGRNINFCAPEDMTDLKYYKESLAQHKKLKNFEEWNRQEIRIFEKKHKIKKREVSTPTEQPKAPLATKEVSRTNCLVRSSRGSTQKQSLKKTSGANSFGNPSFGQVSGRGSKISITITHKSSKNSEFNNNIIISHSLQNSGVHNNMISNKNLFKIESPNVESGSQSPEQIRISVEEETHSPRANFDHVSTINKKNLTFNPNDSTNNQCDVKTNIESIRKLMKQEQFPNEIVIGKKCLDVEIPQMEMGSSFEESNESMRSNESPEEASANHITENTFGQGMDAVIKEVKEKNVFVDSLNSFKQQPPSDTQGKLTSKHKNSSNTDSNYIFHPSLPSKPNNKSISSKRSSLFTPGFQPNSNKGTEFYYEREHIGNGDSSYKFSASDNSSRFKNIPSPNNSRELGPSSRAESNERLINRRSKQEILRGKLNSPVRKRIIEEVHESIRNDNVVHLIEVNHDKADNMTHSELIALRNKKARGKNTQLYDNKSAVMILEKSKHRSVNVSPVRKKANDDFKISQKVKIRKESKKTVQEKPTAVMVMKSKGRKNCPQKHLNFVNISHDRSTLEDKIRSKRGEPFSQESLNSRPISLEKRSRAKDTTVEKKVKKKKKQNSKKGDKKIKVSKRELKKVDNPKQTRSTNKSFKSKYRESRTPNKSSRNHSKNLSASKNITKNSKKNRKASSPRKLKNKPSTRPRDNSQALNSKGKRAAGYSRLKPQKNKQILEIKIMKHSQLNGMIETNLEFYDLKRLLGEGSYAKVHLGVSVLCSKKVAIKLYDKAKIKSKSSSERIFTEIDILRRMNHRNIVNLIEIFQNKKYIFIVLEYANGGDLLNYLKNQGRFKEAEFRKILQQIIDGLEYIHEHQILHRDIKLDNILLTQSGLVKICDFGISRKMNRKDLIFEHIGTPAYIAPEIIKEEGYSGFTADIWSLGVTIYMALTGNVPFKGSTIEQLHKSILEKEIVFPERTKLSNEMKRAIRGMLIKDPAERISLKEVCKILDLRRTINRRPQKNYADQRVISEIRSFGYPEEMIRQCLENDVINHITALYKLIKN